MLLTLLGLIEARRSVITRPPPLNSRSTDVVVAGIQWIIDNQLRINMH